MCALLTLPLTFLTGIIAALFSDVLPRLKWTISYVYVWLYRKLTRKRFDLYDFDVDHDPEKTGFLIPKLEKELETPLKESLLQRNADDIFCYGVNGTGECLLVQVSRRCNQESQAIVYLKLANGKTYSLPEDAPQYQQPSSDTPHAFTCGGLKVYYLAPMRRWRIFFSGFLREHSPENPDVEEIVYVKFAFLWRASSDVFDSLSSISTSELATALSAAKWKWPIPPLQRLHETLDFYGQAGMLFGTVRFGDMPEEREMWMWGERLRFRGKVADMEGAEFLHVLSYTPNGRKMHVGKISIPGVVDNLHFGFFVSYTSIFCAVEKAEIRPIKNVERGGKEDRNLQIMFTAGQQYKMDITIQDAVPSLQNHNGRYSSFGINNISIDCGTHGKGNGFIISGSIGKDFRKPTSIAQIPVMPKVPPLVVKFTDPLCQLLDLSGGKGSSLAKLMSISEKQSKHLFSVPKGVVVTTAAYCEFTKESFEDAVKNLEDVAYGKTSDNLQDVCERISHNTSQRLLSKKLCRVIEDTLRMVFPENINSLRFAVRSSATGEDTEQMSAAGQMDTFLGVRGLKEILTAVKKCWASQFKFVAVEYKRRNGQPLNSPMAVVIQEMVQCDVAGVLFTCHPMTGNPSIITITANYGLGESVVSGSVEPDTVTLRRDHRNHLRFESYDVGEKTKRIVMQGAEGIEEESVDESMRNSHCLSDETSLKLSRIALMVEQSYRSHRDIEWGLKDKDIFLLQARPVTSVSAESNFEILHEFDGPMRCEKEYFTVANVGEVMPGAMSPLGLDVNQKIFSLVFQSTRYRKKLAQGSPTTKYFPLFMPQHCNHLMLSLFMLIMQIKEEKTSTIAQSSMVGLFGRILDDPELLADGRELLSDVPALKISLRHQFYHILNLFLSGHYQKKLKKQYENYSIAIENCRNSQELFDKFMYGCTDFSSVNFSHFSSTSSSSMLNMYLLSTLANSKGGFDNDVYKDFAYLLSTCTGVESADVPSAMQSLALCISKEIDKAEFKAMKPEEALKWLQMSPGVAGAKFRDFISRHGHRCLKEFDVRSVTWGMDPKPLVKHLQGLVGNVPEGDSKKKEFKINDVLSSLTIPLNLKSRLLVRFLLPQCRRAVKEREGSKALTIKCFDTWRKVCYHLGEMMVHEGRIPDKDLIFFFTVEEIQELIKTPSAKLISKANHRRRLFPEMNSYIFPEIMKGIPKPISENEPEAATESDLTMKGVPVSQGVVKGPARVAITLQEAAFLKPGEILITYGTDIGWSPYFPFLGGVVTELGGLISHGAVVAREYGLPCVVGLHGATRKFKTGDHVLLDGNRGILQRIVDDK